MACNIAKTSLSPARQRLVDLMRRLHFGQILGLRLRGGQPVFDPPPQAVRDIKLASEDGPRSVRGDDFLLKQQVVELFAVFDRLGDGVVDLIDVRHGLPFRVQFAEPLS